MTVNFTNQLFSYVINVSNEDQSGDKKDQIPETELLGPAVFTGIEGKHNYLICFDKDRQSFLARNGERIARTALEGRTFSSNYTEFGLDNIETSSLLNHAKNIAGETNLNSYRLSEILDYGQKDLLICRPDSPRQIALAWLPSTESTGDNRPSRNILVAGISDNDINRLMQLASGQPEQVYDLLIKSYYPNALAPLSEDEILTAVNLHADEIIRLAWQHPDTQALCRERRNHPGELIAAVQPYSVIKRMAACNKVEVVT